MTTSKQTSILMDCIDLLAGIPHLSDTDKSGLTQSIINTLGSYPKPQKKNKATGIAPHHLGAYLYTSTAHNAIRLAQLEYIALDKAFSVAGYCLEASLSLLTNKE